MSGDALFVFERLEKHTENGIDLLEHLVVPEAKHAIALALQPPGSLRVVAGAQQVLPSIEFDDQPFVETSEVNDEGTDGLLPPEFVTINLTPADS